MKRGSYSKSCVFYKRRFGIAAVFICLWFAAIMWRLIELQIIHSAEYLQKAKRQQFWEIELNPLRGYIYDKNGEVLAMSINSHSIYIIPKEVDNPVRTSLILSYYLSMPFEEILNKINNSNGFFWLKRKVETEVAELIMRKKLSGVYTVEESSRYYPARDLGAHVIGFVGLDNIGLEGSELYYDKVLKGEAVKVKILKDARSRDVIVQGSLLREPVKGSDLYLTINSELQYVVEEELEIWVKEHEAKRGVAIVMNPRTGEIYALANYPDYDLNRFNNYPIENRRNLATQMEFEPGSIFKVVIAAAALEERLVDPKDRFDCENGSIVLAGFTIRDHKPFGLLSFEEIIENSSNVGAIKIGMKLGASNVYKYATKLGIGRKTGIDLNGEGRGYIRPLRKWSGLSIGAVSIGQEVFVTPLQMLRVLAIIANGGYDVKPHVGYKIISPKGLAYYLNDDSVGKEKILSDYTIDNLRGFLRGVVMRGTGKLAELEGYGVSGKTGTAQKIGPSKTYADGGIIASFMGYFPSYNPKVVMLVLIDEPTGVFWGSQIAAPLFSRIARRTAEVLRIPPSEPLLYASVKQKESTAPSDSLNKNYAQIGEAMMRGTIPDFKGLPLEEALMWITEMKIPFKFIGYGKVIAQIPDPGFPISLTNGIIIYLSPEGS